MAIAAIRVDQSSAEPLMQRAISQSDNTAADRMWNMIGDSQTAADAMEGILREGGDTEVTVQSQQVRPPYSPLRADRLAGGSSRAVRVPIAVY
ncbi:hypothetical protein M4D79_21110 [Mycolicibacterium novocastrense]|nr:hypothetical protein M4D79_21110 [Mycolicibacterium novocastrense]